MLTLLTTQARGSKQYELTDHLGNIRTVVPDIKEPQTEPTQTTNYLTDNDNFRLPTLTLNNYYPYGMLQAGRSRNAGGYRFGFQGQEADNKIGGLGQHLNYTFRNYDSWIIRFGAIDPLAAKYPHNSTYAFSENRVIDGVELEGAEHIHYQARYNSVGQLAIIKTGEIDYQNWILNGYYWLSGSQFEFAPVHVVNGPDGLHYLFTTEKEARNAKISDFNPNTRYTEEGIAGLFTLTDALGNLAVGSNIRTPKTPKTNFNRAAHIDRIRARKSTYVNPSNDHHIVPVSLRNDPVVQAAQRAGLQFDADLTSTNLNGNKIPIESYRISNGSGTHNGNHPDYSKRVASQLKEFHDNNPSYSDQKAFDYVRQIQNGVLEQINKYPNAKITTLQFTPKP